jgi:hypothetical protein
MARRRWRMLNSAKAAEKAKGIEDALRLAREEDSKPVAVIHQPSFNRVEPIVRNPVEIYENGRWVIVDKSSRDFPFPIKMKVTPDWALEVVTERNDNNRSVRDDRVEKYITDILNGGWHVINNGFGFYEDGQLADGQHRLWAIVEAKQTVEVVILFGMERVALSSIDEGASRSNKDVAHMMGLEASHAHLSITNYVLEYSNRKRTTPRIQQISFFERHKEAVDFVVSRLRRKGITKAPVMAAIMRAWYSIDRDRLAQFVKVLDSGQMESNADSAAITLREWLLKHNNNSGPFRAEMYRKTEAALVNFMNGTPISRLYGMEKEQFLLPEEKLSQGISQTV